MYNARMPKPFSSAGRRPARRWPLAAFATLWLVAGIAGCGQTGPLYLPAEPARAPVDEQADDTSDETDDSADDPIA